MILTVSELPKPFANQGSLTGILWIRQTDKIVLCPEKLVRDTATYLGIANVSNGKDIGLSFHPQVRVNLQATFGIQEIAELSISQP
jgi:hypothetical protein